MGLYVFKPTHFSIGNWKDISIAQVIIIIKSEVSTFPIVIIFFRGCVQFMMSAHIRIRFGLQILHVLVCLYSTPSHYHHCANLSEGIELINACQIYVVECVSKIKHILSVIHYTICYHYTICGAVCFQFTHSSCDDWENIYTLSYYHHHQIGSMNYYPLFRVRSWNNGVRCMSFYILSYGSASKIPQPIKDWIHLEVQFSAHCVADALALRTSAIGIDNYSLIAHCKQVV